jgi:hypothetical protein
LTPYRGAPYPAAFPAVAIEGIAAGMVVAGALCGAGAVQPAVVTAPGLADAGIALAAQLGGADNPPTEAAWPRPANIGTPPEPAKPAGPTAPVGAVTAASATVPPSEMRPCPDLTRRPPPHIPSRSDDAEDQFPPPMSKMFARSPPGGSAAAAFTAEPERPVIPPGDAVAAELADSVAVYERALVPKV